MLQSSINRFLTPVVAVGAVDLSKKLPWSTNYELYGSRRISTMDVMQSTGAPVFQTMFNQGQGAEENATHAVGGVGGASGGVAAPNGGGSSSNGNGNGRVGAGGGEASGGAGGALGGGGAGAVVAQAPVPSFGVGGGGGGKRTAALGDVPAPEVDIVEVMGQEDEGAGVFGAILHEPGETGVQCVHCCTRDDGLCACIREFRFFFFLVCIISVLGSRVCACVCVLGKSCGNTPVERCALFVVVVVAAAAGAAGVVAAAGAGAVAVV